MRKFRRSSKGSKQRLIVLGAALVLTLAWAQSEMGGRRSAPKGDASAAMARVATAGPAQVAVALGDQATPEGWGMDPFDPRPLGSTPVTTGR